MSTATQVSAFAAPIAGEFQHLGHEFLMGQTCRPVRVLLVEDDAHMRKVISRELLADLRIDLVAQAGSLSEGRRLVASQAFDVLLVDLNLGDGNGFQLIEYLKVHRPLAEAVVISAMEDEQHALQAFATGATGYLVKNSRFGNLPQALLQVVSGGACISPNLARRLLRKLEQPGKNVCGQINGHEDRLTAREKEILKMVSVGYTSIEVAARLAIGAQTVSTHIKNIYRKLQVHNRAQAISSAANLGLI